MKYYITHTQLERLEGLGFTSSYLPSINDVIDWLREERGIHIFITYNGIYKGAHLWKYNITNIQSSCTSSCDCEYITYYDCLTNAIDSSIDILEHGVVQG